MAYIVEADVEAVRSPSYTSTSWNAGQYTDAITAAEAWADDELNGFGGVSLTATDWPHVKMAMCLMALHELCAGHPTADRLKNQAIAKMLGVKRRRNRTANRIRDNGTSIFGSGSADGKTDMGTARGALF